MSSLPPNGSVHGLKIYEDYSPTISFSTMQAFIPFLYIVPTACVMVRILILYRRARAASNSATMDTNIFACIMFYFLFNTLFFIGDYLHLNLPSSGLITSWCSDTNPSRLYAILFIFAYSANYATIICPFLVTMIRLTILLSPRHNERYCRLIMRRFGIPFLFIMPLLLTISNSTATGYCKQMAGPFGFGSLIIYEGDFHAELNIYIHFAFTCFIALSSSGMSSVMFYKLRMTVFQGTSSSRTKKLTRKAEWSLSLTMASSLVPFITNTIVNTTFIFNRPFMYYVLFLRPIGNDYETVMLPWVLYLTHPMFKLKKAPKVQQNSASNIWVNGGGNPNGSRSSQLC